ncbi:hypothetical protein RF11_04011 [Thelohanellus kitauei]|uniref:Uncharacterized protein n=1 Tax=Thelohanellus kitauei TaxID=669202 RepID=A0A0C2IV38_THEKT|nr:hypothetical protein RF11_04011 [Thelohanellus kitauei]
MVCDFIDPPQTLPFDSPDQDPRSVWSSFTGETLLWLKIGPSLEPMRNQPETRSLPSLPGGTLLELKLSILLFLETCSSLVVARSMMVCDFIAPSGNRSFESLAPAP